MNEIFVGALGGTIAMAQSGNGTGVSPKLDAAQLIATIPELKDSTSLMAETLFALPSATLSFENLLDVLKWAKNKVADGARGIVVTQGTDSLEESAYLLDLFWGEAIPLVVTGAMRSAAASGADGPANLLAAIRVASAQDSCGRGVLVVMNDMIHAASRVVKNDALAVQAFTSPVTGPLGVMLEGKPVYFHPPMQRNAALVAPVRTDHQVALLEASFGDTPRLLELAAESGYYAGIVVAAFGAGHLSAACAEAVGRYAPTVPILISTRTGANSTAFSTYDYQGSEIDLAGRGAVMAGWKLPRKARILLWALLSQEIPASEVADAIWPWLHQI